MFKNKLFIISLVFIFALIVTGYFYKAKQSAKKNISIQEIIPELGDIRLTVTTTGVVEPQNRLEIKPSISGRIEEILVKEGTEVKKGDILAWMSSTERAALVDAATSQGEQARQYWEDVYKKTPIISPISGEVIVRSFEPGQTITTSEPLLVLSDRLIVSAQFDETDIGRVKVGQKANITLDAYPNNKIKGMVGHIAYESQLANNVTIYDVDIVPQEVPEFFRSGMSANVEVIEKALSDVILVPVSAVQDDDGKRYVTVKKKQGKGSEKRQIEVGLTDTNNAEVISGLSTSDIVLVSDQKYFPVKKREAGKNPFMPERKR
ncbi:MAG: RND transporter [Omnitrophica WOR_2 bacterium GWF2_38_59]|nr:MAG: RND transporter [Omnitrophica WOR_2 bacterium GWA2_37_7]OGX23674.1 MAG: RND transporter [Omnitrophica WOR_2 bacterium GWF2_38_59]OGX47407.1 MAG: RND transporter [Omnitrophica WOR_2 bacterium RIFOXYA2_FULL_38_17]OGX55030.1 MAG: RND transporter [Omnitrophica WOR_2 bacterium RIFOXYC2_FULL_38_12]OGX57987.1 MAG: RND transporter [Omnitrophica WOR_2 bacterium RIFOXYB2_FULL_38_16]HBG62291.1 RND transporter [Candidatus Omnitrophota bacterium]